MLSDDQYNNQIVDTKHTLADWAERNKAGAHIVIEDDPAYWRIHAEPYQSSHCPIELILRPDRHYDLSIAGASAEDQPIKDFVLFAALFEAVSDGSIVVRSYRTAATHLLLGNRTTVIMPERDDWEVISLTPLGEQIGWGDALIETRKFARYVPSGR